jgi:protein required for attachment to host cells
VERYGTLWVVVADGEHARVLAPAEVPGQYRTIRSWDSVSAHQKSADMGSDEPGRAHESASATRHAIAPRHDPHALAKRRFIEDLARQLGEEASQGAFDRLVLVAPAHAMHDLRVALPRTAATRLVGELQKDLVKTPDHEIGGHLTWEVLHAGSGVDRRAG